MRSFVPDLSKFLDLSWVSHLVISGVIRLVLVSYGEFHDRRFEVPYTDVDYKVFSDAARHVIHNRSPYNRHTYRYSPLIAYLLTPNVLLHPLFGKLLFCLADLLVAFLIRKLVFFNITDWMSQFESYTSKTAPIECAKKPTKTRKGRLVKYNLKIQTAHYWAQRAMLFWLYNPMTIAISTRGNSDSLACLLVIVTVYLIQVGGSPFAVGLLHGLCIHFRLYPIIYSLLYYMHYSSHSYYFEMSEPEKKIRKSKVLKKSSKNTVLLGHLIPNISQMKLVLGTLTSLLGLTGLFYLKYGSEFLNESMLFHLTRVDFRHNFSLYFYLQYLTAFVKLPVWFIGNFWQPLLINLPPVVLFIYFSIRYGLSKFALNFGVLALTVTFVIFNKVVTSQYFVWIMGLLPLCMWQIKLSSGAVISMLAIWFLAQASWLLPAYLLEFKGENTFMHVWIQGVSLFCAHIGIFGKLIKHFILPFGELKNFDPKPALNGYSRR